MCHAELASPPPPHPHTSSSSVQALLRLEPDFNKTTSTSTMRPPPHTALCPLRSDVEAMRSAHLLEGVESRANTPILPPLSSHPLPALAPVCLWRRTSLSSKSVFQLSVANRALDVDMPMPFCSLCLRHSQIHTPVMKELLDDFFNPARTRTQLQPDCSLDLKDATTTAHCSLLSAPWLTGPSDEVGPSP